MVLGDFIQMHINNLASFEIFVVESNYDELRTGNAREELLLGDLSVLTMPVDKVLSFLRLFGFHGGYSHFF